MSKQREALQMALEMIELNKHERRHVRWAIKDALASKSSIAQAIRDAAVNWPQFLGDVECEILHAFCGDWARSALKNNNIRAYLAGVYGTEGKIKARTFMLLVADELES